MHRVIFGWEATDDICGESHVGHMVDQEITNFAELFHSVFTVHLLKHRVRPRLNWHMQELVDSRMVHDVGHRLQVFEDKWRIGHSKSEHHMIRHDCNNRLEKCGQVCVDVAAIRSGVFRG